MKNAIDLTGHHVLVTGAGGAIGGAAARACAALGAKLSIADLRAPEGLAQELHTSGSEVRAYALDNSVRTDVEKVIAEAGELDALCDCSGYYVKGDWVDGADDWEALYRKTMNVNVLGPFNLVRAVLPGMVKRRYGRIALTTSMAARNAGSTLSVEPAYAASKHGIAGLTKAYCDELAPHGIQVNGIAPGYYTTALTAPTRNDPDASKRISDRIPSGRWGEPLDLMGTVVFLASRASDYVNGQILAVDGGYLVR